MKQIISIVAVIVLAVLALAQNHTHIHIFRNDRQFHTIKGADVRSISFNDSLGDYNEMIVELADSSIAEYPMDSITDVMWRSTAIPEFHIDLLDHPEWTELQGSKTDTHPALLRMDGNGMYDDLPEQEVEFRGRGNSSWRFDKKPYRFKMKSKSSVCGLAKAKTFVLIANYIDCSQMRNATALWLSNHLEMPYANHCIPVKVYLNGIDKGQYMLTEKIGIGSGSVDIDETTGMLFELDSNYDEDYKFFYTFKKPSMSRVYKIPVMVKDPDLEDLFEVPEDSIGTEVPR